MDAFSNIYNGIAIELDARTADISATMRSRLIASIQEANFSDSEESVDAIPIPVFFATNTKT
jgi:hypothetical protein